VPVPTPELERLPHNGRRSISNYLNLDGYHAAFHPKDAATFSALLGDVELLGDREVGRLGYAIQDCLFTLEGATFDFTVKGCWVKLQLRVLLQGRIISADGEKRNGTLGLLDPKDYASRKLAARLRECIDVALRHETPGQ
jgi:hypothetical protein